MSRNESADNFCFCFLCTHLRECLSFSEHRIDFLQKEEPRQKKVAVFTAGSNLPPFVMESELERKCRDALSL